MPQWGRTASLTFSPLVEKPASGFCGLSRLFVCIDVNMTPEWTCSVSTLFSEHTCHLEPQPPQLQHTGKEKPGMFCLVFFKYTITDGGSSHRSRDEVQYAALLAAQQSISLMYLLWSLKRRSDVAFCPQSKGELHRHTQKPTHSFLLFFTGGSNLSWLALVSLQK